MTCSCTIECDDGNPEDTGSYFIHFCPLHKAAGELLEAAKSLIAAQDNSKSYWVGSKPPRQLLLAAIAQATRTG